MLEIFLTLVKDPSFIVTLQQWLLAVTSVVTAASAITALTPTKKDDKIRGYILSFLNFLALNIGNARNKDGRMLSGLFIFVAITAIFVLVMANGKWRQRAKAAEAQNKANRKAHAIQNAVATDPDYRERVRRHFDGS